MTLPTDSPGLKADVLVLWQLGVDAHPNADRLRTLDVVEGLLGPAVDAWQAAPSGDDQILAALDAGWHYGFRRNVLLAVASAAEFVQQDLRAAQERVAARPGDLHALSRAAHQAGIDPADPENDLLLHALADAFALSGTDLSGPDRRVMADLDRVIGIAGAVVKGCAGVGLPADRARPGALGAAQLGTITALAHHGPARPTQLGIDAIELVRPVDDPARRLLGAAGAGWSAGLVVAEELGAVFAVHRIAAIAKQSPGLRIGIDNPTQWAKQTLQPVRERLADRLGTAAARRASAVAIGLARQSDFLFPTDGSIPRDLGKAFRPLTDIDPNTRVPTGPGPSDSRTTPSRPRR
jgi:hypothetical protein